ncbi:MAG: glycosyltransferase [Bacteroidetes bacterium]|nr:glycosyltransferase [Bacteroidota bacterium]
MKIIIDCNPLSKNIFSDEYNRYIIKAIFHLQKTKPDAAFVFATSKISTQTARFFRPDHHLVVRKSWPGLAGMKQWYRKQLPEIIKETNSELLVSTGIVTPHIQIPQCLWIPGIMKEDYARKKYFNWIQKKLSKGISQVKIVFTPDEEKKEQIAQFYNLSENKIISIPHTADENAKPISWQEREEIKVQYASGREFFLLCQPELPTKDFIILLKAFSQFKKRQQSNMQLIVVGVKNEKKYLEKIDGFKYRMDVHIYDAETDFNINKMVAAAYALLLPVTDNQAFLNSFSRQVPIVTTRDGYPGELDTDAVLYADFADTTDLATKMMLLYKDEPLRNMLVEKGKSISEKFNVETQSEQLWRGFHTSLSHPVSSL